MSGHGTPIPMQAGHANPLTGTADVPGDKSISHRSLMFGAMALGKTEIFGLLEGEDVLDTAKAMRAFGAEVTQHGPGHWTVHGVGVGGLAEPETVIDCGNSGTGVRLIMGMMATSPITATFTGDASLNKRPMARITDPLALFGAQSVGRSQGRLPLTIVGAENPVPLEYHLPVASAQVKSAVLLAGLNAPGKTTVVEPKATRDHTERMLRGFGAELTVEDTNEGRVITLTGQPELKPQTIHVPRDPSSAAFPVCAALITPGSDVLVRGEPVADLRARYSPNMVGINVPEHRAASMIDEYPILSVVAANATGVTHMGGVHELRVKESDRIDSMAQGLRANGITVDEGEDWWAVTGLGAGNVPGGATCETFLDHRIAMSFLILGFASKSAVVVNDGGPIATSFPIFEQLMGDLGANIERISV